MVESYPPAGEPIAAGELPAAWMVLQPAWRFTGRTGHGDEITFLVQAVSPAYLEP
jgi:hypothetical protein